MRTGKSDRAGLVARCMIGEKSPLHSLTRFPGMARYFDFANICAQNPSKEGGIMRSKGFPILGLVLALALAASAQTKAGVKQEVSVAHQQSPRFLQIVNESRKRVR